MTRNAFHDRAETLRAVLVLADERRDGAVPMDAPGVAENFADEVDLVASLLLTWRARLCANVERELSHEPMDLPGAVAAAWRDTAEQMPGFRLIADACADRPAETVMARLVLGAQEREWVRLALASGLGGMAGGTSSLAAGRSIEAAARAALPDLERPTSRRTSTASITGGPARARTLRPTQEALPHPNAALVARIKAVLAAA